MTNPRSRRHNAEATECLLSPFQKHIALMVTFHFQTDVLFESVIITETIHRYGVVYDKINWRKRIHFCRIPAQTFYRFAHSGQIDHCGYAGKVLHQNASGSIGNLTIGMRGFQPTRQGMNIVFGNGIFVLPAKQVLQQNF